MTVSRAHVFVRVAFCLLVACLVARQADASTDVALFRVFLTDGTSLPSYGEYVRVGDDIVFSMPIGTGDPAPPLHVVTLAATEVDWARTEQYAASVRFQRYAATRGEEDFDRLTTEVAAMLNEIALTTEPARARAIAERARRMLIEWPDAHYGYRRQEVAEIVSLIDEALRGLGPASSDGSVALSLVAMAPPVALEPVLGLPSSREQVAQIVSLVRRLPRPSDRIALLEAALALLDKSKDEDFPAGDAESARRAIRAQLQEERSIDARYTALARRLVSDARRAARQANVSAVERLLGRIDDEDERLGRRRPDAVMALRTELEAQLAAARELRLRRDAWQLRRHIYERYVEDVERIIERLVEARSALDAIRRLAGPAPSRLRDLLVSLGGGAERLRNTAAPEALQATHELLVNAWRFAETAIETRHAAVASGDMGIAWRASSAAAGSLMLLSRAQAELRQALEPPRLP